MRAVAAAVVTAGLLLVPVAVAATPGTYEGWLYTAGGKRIKATQTKLVVSGAEGDRFLLSIYNLRLGCPYRDDEGERARARMRVLHRGVVQGTRIDDTREYQDTHVVRVVGIFTGRRFAGRISVEPAPGVTGACSGGARVRVSR